MKKTVCLAVIMILMLVLNSCIKEESNLLSVDKDNKLADTRMESLFDAIKQNNKDAIKANFSEKAIDESGDIDVEIERLLSFVQGKVVSWNREESPMVIDSVERGNKKKQLVTWFTLETEEQNYSVLLVDYPIDTIDTKNAGLYSIRILRAEDENKLEGTLEEWVIPGIFILDK